MTTDSKTRGFKSVGKGRGLAVLGLLVAGGLIPGCIIDGGSSCGPTNITFDWFITANGIPRSCAQVGATTVSIRVDNDAMIADFNCVDGAGTTVAVAGGFSHSVAFRLTDSAGNILSELTPTSVPTACNGLTDLGSVEFSLTPP